MKLSPQKLTLYTILLLAVALVGLIAWQRLAPTPSTPAAAFTGDFELETQPMIGDPDAPATIVAFEDFKCPVCKADFPPPLLPILELGRDMLSHERNIQERDPGALRFGSWHV
jgi:hypothetical protein